MRDVLCNEIQYISVPNGEIAYYINSNLDAVLVDYIGTGKILFIPEDLGIFDERNDMSIPIADYIPDESFQSCTNLEIIVVGTSIKFGQFVFTNSSKIKTIIEVGDVSMDEFSFTDNNFVPERPNLYSLKPDHYWQDYSYNHYADISGGKKLLSDLVIQCAMENDCARLMKITELKSIGASIRSAIAANNVKQLLYIESLGIPIDDKCPFVMEITDAINNKAWDAVDFMLSRRTFRVSWTDGSAIYIAVKNNDIELVQKLLKAGASPFSTSPEWDGNRPVIEIAMEQKKTDIYNVLKDAQNAN